MYVDTTFYIQCTYIQFNSWQTLRFQKQQNQSVSGLSEAARNKRKHRNVVAMKFNLINYILETVSMILMLIFKEEVIILLYLLTNSCGTPLVYYLGIEENRKQAQEYFRWEEESSSTQEYLMGTAGQMCGYSREGGCHPYIHTPSWTVRRPRHWSWRTWRWRRSENTKVSKSVRKYKSPQNTRRICW